MILDIIFCRKGLELKNAFPQNSIVKSGNVDEMMVCLVFIFPLLKAIVIIILNEKFVKAFMPFFRYSFRGGSSI